MSVLRDFYNDLWNTYSSILTYSCLFRPTVYNTYIGELVIVNWTVLDCMSVEVFDSSSGVYGYSQVRRPISRACTSRAEAAISNNGLSQEDFYILPMKLPSRCVLNQVCTVAPVLQRFRQTIGFAFPAINRRANSN